VICVPTKEKAGEDLHACIGEFAIVGEAQGLEVGEFAERFDPFVVGFGRDNIERLQGGDVTEVLEECRIIRILFAMIVRACIGHGEIDEFEALTVTGLLDFALRGHDGADDGFDMRIERERSGSGEDAEKCG
jgi:hypothetical protein